MRSIHDWFSEYNESHRNPTNKRLHWICVPLIVVSLVGLLWSLPVPARFVGLPIPVNWAGMFIACALLYYTYLSPGLAAGMVPVVAAVVAVVLWMERLPGALWMACLLVFVISWIGQFIGHCIEGRSPSFFKDVQFLLIGPLWLLGHFYRRLGIRY